MKIDFKGNFLILSLLCLFLADSALGLVEYSNDRNLHSKRSAGKAKSIRVKKRLKKSSSGLKKRSFRKFVSKRPSSILFDFVTGYEGHKASLPQGEGTVGFYTVNGRFQTDVDIYMDINYWHTASNKGIFSGSEGEKKGNTSVKLGFNWLRVGKPANQSVVNFYGGMMLPVKNTQFASSRTDKMLGIETSKRFGTFLMAFGFDLRLTGTPSDADEMDIGNISTVMGGISWMASSDIRFVLELATVNISAGNNEQRAISNEKKVSFSYLSPQFSLSLSPLVNFKMGARFNSKRIEDKSQLSAARLWDLKGAFGNSIFTELSITI